MMTPNPGDTVALASKKFEDHDDCLTAAREKVAQEYGLELWQTDARWEDDQRDRIIVTVWGRA